MPMWPRRLKQQQELDAHQRRQDRDAEIERENRRTELLAAQSTYAKGMFWANILLATLTLVLAGIAAWQAKLTHDSVGLARDSTDAAVKSAEDSAKFAADTLTVAKESAAAATKSAAVAEQTLKSTQSAYLTVGTWALKSPLRSGEPVNTTCTVQNVGPTRAILVSSKVSTYIGTRLPAEPKYETLHDEGMVALGSQQPYLREFRNTVPLTLDEFERIQSSAWVLFTYGFVEYEDIFNQRHKAPFCVQYDVKNDRLNQCAQRNYHESWPTQTQP